MLAHYTSVDGFHNIVKNDCLRMTRSEFMNDPADSKIMGKMIKEYLNHSNKEEEIIPKDIKSIYDKAPVVKYLDFVQEKIHLYVLSFTDKSDEMEFWNYYGNGGVQLNIEEDKLLDNMAEQLVDKEEYIACAPVMYVNENCSINDIKLYAPLSQFCLHGKNNKLVFEENMEKLDDKKRQLYEIDNIKKFVDYFINDYGKSLSHLLLNSKIDKDSTEEEIMTAVFDNQSAADNELIFKKDFLIYMILLSALVKSNSYEYEKESRIVYFQNALGSKKTKEAEFESKNISGQTYLRPYIEFKEIHMYQSLNDIMVSPLTRNVPIDDSLYKQTVLQFMRKYHYDKVDIDISRHRCRW